MRVAVFGATGVAGRAFVAAAQAAGLALGTRRADLLDPSSIGPCLRGCAAVVDLVTAIPKPGGRGSWAMNDRLRREGTAHLLAACAQAGVQTVVLQSVAMLHNAADDRPQTEDDPLVGYGVLESAADMEALASVSPLDVRVVRGGLFYGADSGREAAWIDEVRQPGFRVPGDGSAWMSPVHVEDFARALVTVLTRGAPRQACIACDDDPLRWSQLYARAAERAGVPAPPVGGPLAMRSFRTSNARLRGLGWKSLHAALADAAPCAHGQDP